LETAWINNVFALRNPAEPELAERVNRRLRDSAVAPLLLL